MCHKIFKMLPWNVQDKKIQNVVAWILNNSKYNISEYIHINKLKGSFIARFLFSENICIFPMMWYANFWFFVQNHRTHYDIFIVCNWCILWVGKTFPLIGGSQWYLQLLWRSKQCLERKNKFGFFNVVWWVHSLT